MYLFMNKVQAPENPSQFLNDSTAVLAHFEVLALGYCKHPVMAVRHVLNAYACAATFRLRGPTCIDRPPACNILLLTVRAVRSAISCTAEVPREALG